MEPYLVGHWWDCCCCIPLTCQAWVFDSRCNGVDYNSQPCADVTSSCNCPPGYDGDGSINGLYPYASFGGNCEGIYINSGRLNHFIWSGNSCYNAEDNEWSQVRVCLTCGTNPNNNNAEEWIFIIAMDVETPDGGGIFPAWGVTWYPLDHFVIDENGIINGTGSVEIHSDGPGTEYYCNATAILSADSDSVCPRPAP